MVKVKITKQVVEEVEVDIKFPYYYKDKRSYSGGYESTMYGVKNEEVEIRIRRTIDPRDNKKSFEISVEPLIAGVHYFDKENESNEEEFKKIYSEAMEFMKSINENYE
jgi:hypothetical protein